MVVRRQRPLGFAASCQKLQHRAVVKTARGNAVRCIQHLEDGVVILLIARIGFEDAGRAWRSAPPPRPAAFRHAHLPARDRDHPRCWLHTLRPPWRAARTAIDIPAHAFPELQRARLQKERSLRSMRHWPQRASPLIYSLMTSFLKMHGLGNDFVVFDGAQATARARPDGRSRHRRPALRHRLRPGHRDRARRTASPTPSCVSINADGGEVESCGNAARCVARLLMEETGRDTVHIDTPGGPLICSDAGSGLVTVDMGAPRLKWNKVPLAQAADTNMFQLERRRRQPCRKRGVRGQSALRAVRGRCRDRARRRAGPADRNPSDVSQAHQCRVRQRARPRQFAHAGVGARRRHHPGLRNRRLRNGSRRASPRPRRTQGRDRAGRRRACRSNCARATDMS